MFTLVQLSDGCYKLTVDVLYAGSVIMHREYTFKEVTSDAEPMPNGEFMTLQLDLADVVRK